MFRVPLLVAVVLGIAFVGGIFSTLWALDATVGFGAIRLGAWEAFPDAQTADADPYAKAHRAEGGKLLYGSAEGLSFQADRDDEGAALSAACNYRLSGQTPIARVWSLTVAGRDGRALADPEGRPMALNSWTVLRRKDTGFEIELSGEARPGNWLFLPGEGPFRLVLTLLDTPTAGSSGLLDLAMPSLTRLGCGRA